MRLLGGLVFYLTIIVSVLHGEEPLGIAPTSFTYTPEPPEISVSPTPRSSPSQTFTEGSTWIPTASYGPTCTYPVTETYTPTATLTATGTATINPNPSPTVTPLAAANLLGNVSPPKLVPIPGPLSGMVRAAIVLDPVYWRRHATLQVNPSSACYSATEPWLELGSAVSISLPPGSYFFYNENCYYEGDTPRTGFAMKFLEGGTAYGIRAFGGVPELCEPGNSWYGSIHFYEATTLYFRAAANSSCAGMSGTLTINIDVSESQEPTPIPSPDGCECCVGEQRNYDYVWMTCTPTPGPEWTATLEPTATIVPTEAPTETPQATLTPDPINCEICNEDIELLWYTIRLRFVAEVELEFLRYKEGVLQGCLQRCRTKFLRRYRTLKARLDDEWIEVQLLKEKCLEAGNCIPDP